MSCKKLAVSLAMVVLIVASFFVGAFFSSPSGIMKYDEFESTSPRTAVGAVTDQMSEGLEKYQGSSTVQDRMVIYSGYISLETADIQGQLTKIRSLAESYGGYVAGASRTETYAEITIRVPREKFHTAVQEIETYGKVLDEHTSSEDVTEQYVDLEARLQNLQRQEKRLQEILEMAKTIDEILTIERELERVRGEIESLQGQLNYLERNVAMAIVTVYLSYPPPPFTPPGMDWNEALETALRVLFLVIRGLVIIVISMLPLAIIGFLAYRLYRKKSSKREPS